MTTTTNSPARALTRRVAALALSAAAGFTLTAGVGSAHGQASGLQGEIAIDGSSTVYPITEAAASAFRDEYPNVNVTVGVSGTGGGFKRFTVGDTDISDASRPIKAAEFEQAAQNDISFVELPIALDGLTIVVNPDNDWVDQLSVEDLQQIFLDENTAQNWSDLNSDWPDTPIKVYAPGTESGTFDYFSEVVAGEDGSFQSNISTSEDDNVLVTGVAGDRGAIGFFGASYYFNNQERLKAVPIVNPETDEAVEPTPENVGSGDYAPFARPLFIYVNEQSMRRPEVRTFVNYYLENANQFAEQVDYVGLPEDLRSRVNQHFRGRMTGTHFLTEEMEPRSGPLSSVYTQDNLTTIESVNE